MEYSVIIPARYASTRLPGKPLCLLAGKPMIQHVYENACESNAAEVIVATDDERVFDAVTEFGGQVCMTSDQHESGTSRLVDVIRQFKLPHDRIVVNVQGDEPFLPPALIDQVAMNLASASMASIATLCESIESVDELFDPHAVKVVMDKNGYALYFSRAPIPWDRHHFSPRPAAIPSTVDYYRHIGLYAYRAAFIEQYVEWSSTQLEQVESLEQLRVLWQGHKIHVELAVTAAGHGVDTPDDLQKAEAMMLGHTSTGDL